MKYITKLQIQEAAADEYIGMTDEEDEPTALEPKAEKEVEWVDLHTIDMTPHPMAKETQFKALGMQHDDHKAGPSMKRNGERKPPRQGNSPSFKQIRMRESYDLEEAVEVSHDRYMRSHGKKARDTGQSTDWMFTHKQYGEPSKDEMMSHRGSFKDAKKAAQKWAASKGKYSVYIMESVKLEEEIRAGLMKLKSGESITVSSKDASIINEVLSSLNSTNKKKMEEELMRDKVSYQRMLKFAKEAK